MQNAIRSRLYCVNVTLLHNVVHTLPQPRFHLITERGCILNTRVGGTVQPFRRHHDGLR